jgi:hypothetical protein
MTLAEWIQENVFVLIGGFGTFFVVLQGWLRQNSVQKKAAAEKDLSNAEVNTQLVKVTEGQSEQIDALRVSLAESMTENAVLKSRVRKDTACIEENAVLEAKNRALTNYAAKLIEENIALTKVNVSQESP